jgi:hypothetical protein
MSGDEVSSSSSTSSSSSSTLEISPRFLRIAGDGAGSTERLRDLITWPRGASSFIGFGFDFAVTVGCSIDFTCLDGGAASAPKSSSPST